MYLSMQERDALLAGLAMLKTGLSTGAVVVVTGDPEADPIGDLYTNGGVHKGLGTGEIAELADRLVAEYPCPELGG